MSNTRFAKTLSANDSGATGSHQAGILVPKRDGALVAFFPALNKAQKNPDVWLTCVDDRGGTWMLRYIYYNNELHDDGGTRNEYRITCLTPYLKQQMAKPGDTLVFEATDTPAKYRISLQRVSKDETVIQLRGWRQVH